MVKAGKFLLVFLLIISLTGCDLIPSAIGGNPVKLDEDQSHYFINEDGELRTLTCYEDKTFERTYDIDFDDNEDDIIDDLQDYYDDLDVDIEVADFQKDDDLGFMTTEADDFEPHLNQWFESLEDMADIYGDYEILAANIDFVTYDEDEDTLDEDDLEDYEDGFVILITGGEKGNYYEFESDIAVVDDDMKYDRIKNNIIFVEDDESGYIILDDEVDCDTDFYEDMYDGTSDSSTSSNGGSASSSDSISSSSFFPDNVFDLSLNQILYIFDSSGGLEIHRYIENANLEYDYYYVTPSMEDSDIISGIEDYYSDNYQGTYVVSYFERVDDDFQIIIHCDSAYAYNMSSHSLSESIEMYGGETEFAGYYSMCEAETGNIISDDVLSSYGSHTIYYLFGTGYDSYYIFPEDITSYSYGLVNYEDQLHGNLLHPDSWAWGAVTTY